MCLDWGTAPTSRGMPASTRSLLATLFAAATLGALACSAHSDSSSNPGGSASQPPPAGGTGAGAAAAGGSSGSGGAGTGGGLGQGNIAGEPLHRLNRLEYNNTVRDLLGVDTAPADAFPVDPPLDGFDNRALGLTLSPALFNMYSDSARALTGAALDLGPRFNYRQLAVRVAKGGFAVGDRGWSVYNSELNLDFELQNPESLTVSIVAGGTASRVPMPIMTAYLNGTARQTFNVMATVAAPQPFTFRADLPAGRHSLRVTFDNLIDDPTVDRANQLVLSDITISSDELAYPPTRAVIQTCDPRTAPDVDACYSEILGTFAKRAWRRPLSPDELQRVVLLWQQLSIAEGKESALSLTIRALLLSPRFLYRTSKPLAGATGPEVPLDDFSLASRLSYFIWASMPDAELLAAAEQGQLRETAGLAAQLQRLLSDTKAEGLREGFAAQWLSARKFAKSTPSLEVFPEFDDPLRSAMVEEAKLFFGDFLTSQAPLGDLLTPDFGFANDRLAAHYGYPLPGSDAVVRVPLAPGSRGGIAMQGAWLTAESQPDRTSPVLRGQWLADHLLCIEIPPPPPNVPAEIPPNPGATLRERLLAHRADPACAGCHDMLDPPGLGVEEFDGIGKQRTQENNAPIDSSGSLPGGMPFVGGAGLAAAIEQDPRFYECLTSKLASYALGRLLTADDKQSFAAMHAGGTPQNFTLPQLLEQIVLSPSFRMVSPGVAP